jgi:hypothetical protein
MALEPDDVISAAKKLITSAGDISDEVYDKVRFGEKVSEKLPDTDVGAACSAVDTTITQATVKALDKVMSTATTIWQGVDSIESSDKYNADKLKSDSDYDKVQKNLGRTFHSSPAG